MGMLSDLIALRRLNVTLEDISFQPVLNTFVENSAEHSRKSNNLLLEFYDNKNTLYILIEIM